MLHLFPVSRNKESSPSAILVKNMVNRTSPINENGMEITIPQIFPLSADRPIVEKIATFQIKPTALHATIANQPDSRRPQDSIFASEASAVSLLPSRETVRIVSQQPNAAAAPVMIKGRLFCDEFQYWTAQVAAKSQPSVHVAVVAVPACFENENGGCIAGGV